MLEKQIQEFKVGYRISSDLIRMSKEKIDPNSSEGRIILQREEAMNDKDACIGLGYLASVGVNCLKHPITMYRLLKR